MAIDERVESRLAKWQEGLNKVFLTSYARAFCVFSHDLNV